MEEGCGERLDYTVLVREIIWNSTASASAQLAELGEHLSQPGFLVVRFTDEAGGEALPWSLIEPWTRSRAVTVAEVCTDLAVPALEVALCSDMVYLREGVRLLFPEGHEKPTAGLVWAWGRAGRAALNRGLLSGGAMEADEAAELGLVASVLAAETELPLPDPHSVAALTTARDLLRTSAADGGGSTLELAAFRLLFAVGDPEEGARAFLEERQPDFNLR